ncbi:MAG TPA: J domain-containing protein [Baekduia sp.]|uniref:J domain-containing protein n=1 Tax=Baekduia sp. TaxID=2600305 RepID=UPI002D7916C8|nr:J domain-containing protein [Baekduia sp.]HET6507301.1 J domain-containing protein [Baekduia sp.]
MDPHAVLGLDPGATPDEVQRAYRALAKRFHPDRAGGADGELMISINAAYDLLREQLEQGHAAGPATTAANGTAARPPASSPPPVIAGAWLAPAVRRVLARELLQTLEPGEMVDEVVLTATGDSHDVQLALTDRRLLWLRDDAIMGRVRYVRYRELARVEGRPAGRFRRAGQLRVQARATGRWLRFHDLRPDVLERLTARIRARASA